MGVAQGTQPSTKTILVEAEQTVTQEPERHVVIQPIVVRA